MLSDFFSVNLPYGIAKNKNNEWMAFNRDYLPLGVNNSEIKGMPGLSYLEMPIYTKYKRISEKLLVELAADETGIHRDENGEITKVFFYNDRTNPRNQSSDKKEFWDFYFDKLKKLSKLKID